MFIPSKADFEVLGLFKENPVRLYSINEIASILKKPYPFIFKHVNDLLNAKILQKTVVGRSHLCGLNHSNSLCVELMGFTESYSLQLTFQNNNSFVISISDFLSKLNNVWINTCFILDSNNLVFVVESLDDEKNLKLQLKNVFAKSKIILRKDFNKYFKDNHVSILKESIVVEGFSEFYKLLFLHIDFLKTKYTSFGGESL